MRSATAGTTGLGTGNRQKPRRWQIGSISGLLTPPPNDQAGQQTTDQGDEQLRDEPHDDSDAHQEGTTQAAVTCPACNHEFTVEMADDRLGES